jgi:hypothetical protein
MPAIPDECEPLMQELILLCWSMNPKQPPAFDEIIRTFNCAEFRILSRADPLKLGL